ncbi:MAG: peptidoglycan binding protein CsiV [Gammaproteobacteria bacterium]|nr:peptidoglycan binding protein CsiV [Gammaproteobacteria bacterium]NND61457.1 hypothetical protein [Gammaproteobacteria bacterium]
MNRFMLSLLLTILLMPVPALAQEPPVFDVEVIVFRHVEADNTELPSYDRDAEDNEATPVRRRRYPALSADELRLGGAAQRLLSSSEWSPILHAGWRQPTDSREEAAAMSVAGTRRGASVRGTVRVSVDRFLRMEVDLQLDGGTGDTFSLTQARRVRSGEVHYFDHPQFGVIATVNPAPAP